ncbi:MAG: arginine--tRNA ligase [Candidatus Pacebacteria bacterium]|nr:arginine--tRNA ligase [Candidatus Paceibacterota bacterium]MBT4005092.1 arginine--tRNA ligase [Candidatus Paceibacterota bacterium]MBT4358927.1 arginine--tRNA ligase [Candidatus Paceibacterota bacterium]MBT4680796.1 arginine--tRNA ligase [Candidatus Paceibacterota bacterium]MBT6898773.1 arginine--tRNA ligase [Candidatus Paceibacterota bacterium]
MKITNELQQYLEKALTRLGLPKVKIHLEHPADTTHGDFATNVAMTIFSKLDNEQKQSFKSPRQLAEKIAATIKIPTGLVSKIEVAGPGFINFTLSEHFLLEGLDRVLTNSDQLVDQINSGKKMVVEFTDPNPFKQFHIGHLYSNTVGESIARLFEATGAEVRRANYFGDVGMHVAKSIWGMREKIFHEREESIEQALENLGDHPIEDRVKFLGESYAMGATSFKESDTAKEQINQLNKLLYKISQDIMVAEKNWQPIADYDQHLDEKVKQSWDYDEIKQLYQTGKAWSLAYFQSIYDRVGMSFDNFYPESVVAEYGLELVKKGLADGIFAESKGAVVYDGEKQGLHTRVFINSVGLPTYETKELGLAPAKYRDGEYDASIIITGNEINEYFQVLLAAMKEVEPKLGNITEHIGHGMVRLPSGKMSSRTGKIITGQWLLDEAAEQIAQVLQEAKKGLSEQSQGLIAEQVGQAAIKYAFLRPGIGKDISFDFNESLSFQGNSGPYLQYTYVRCQSVLRKVSESDVVFNIKDAKDIDLSVEEIDLLRNLYQYSEVVAEAMINRSPHLVCTYLYQLAQAFNLFYTKHSILQADQENQKQFRAALTKATAEVLGQGLGVLNIALIEEM